MLKINVVHIIFGSRPANWCTNFTGHNCSRNNWKNFSTAKNTLFQDDKQNCSGCKTNGTAKNNTTLEVDIFKNMVKNQCT